ncbi:MAG: META domain-containing protein [Paracoccaceae bacterium]
MRFGAAAVAAALLGGGALAQEAGGDGDRLVGTLWALETLRGEPFEARAVMAFGEDEIGEPLLRGEAPCNSFRGIYGVQSPEGGMFDAGPLAATRMACPELDAETAFLSALQSAVEAEIEDGRLILRGPEGAEMTFVAEGPAAVRPPSGESADDE